MYKMPFESKNMASTYGIGSEQNPLFLLSLGKVLHFAFP